LTNTLPPVEFTDGTTMILIHHANYPHEAGRLFDCPACESTCLCSGFPGHTQCVFCDGLESDHG